MSKKPTSKDIIPIDMGFGEPAVNARDLWEFLGSKQQFSDWFRNRVETYGFEEGKDYTVFDNSIKNPTGGRPREDYLMLIDMAKELAMVERTPRGKEAREYFIECERRLRWQQEGDQDPAIPGGLEENHQLGRIFGVMARYQVTIERMSNVCYYREKELTQAETATLLNLPRHVVQHTEGAMKSLGIKFKQIRRQERERAMRDAINQSLTMSKLRGMVDKAVREHGVPVGKGA